MNPIGTLFRSSIGRKFLMAITGLILILFVIGHLVGNLQIFSHPDRINGYAEFLHLLGPTLWAARIGLLICALIHIWAAVVLTLENRAARGPKGYERNRWLRASFSSRYMRHTGVVVLAFLVYHLAQFTFGSVQHDAFKSVLPQYVLDSDYHIFGVAAVTKGKAVDDVYSMVFLGFTNPIVSLFYIVAVALLSMHMAHGIQSAFQSIGWRNQKWGPGLNRLAVLFCLAYFLANAAIPGAILSGVLKPSTGTYAASRLNGDTPPTAPNEFK